MNVVTLIGNLATEVEVREVSPERRVASFVRAVDRASRDGGADEFLGGGPRHDPDGDTGGEVIPFEAPAAAN